MNGHGALTITTQALSEALRLPPGVEVFDVKTDPRLRAFVLYISGPGLPRPRECELLPKLVLIDGELKQA